MKTLLLIACTGVLAGCMSFNDRALRPVTQSIQTQLPEIRLQNEFAISIGGELFNLLNIVTLDAADLSDMEHVDVAVYEVSGRGQRVSFDTLDFAATLRAKDKRLHWETIVKVREENEQVWVLVGMDLKRQTLEAVSIFVLEQDELVLINVDGELEQMLRFAMQPASDHRDAMRARGHRI